MKQILSDHLVAVVATCILLFVLLLPILRNVLMQAFFGIVIIPQDSIGLQIKKFVLYGKYRTLPEGRIVAVNGEAGYQAQTLPPGIHWGKWRWQYVIIMQKLLTIEGGKIGLIKAKDGSDLNNGQLLATYVDCDNFQDAIKFLNNSGFKGRQTQVLTPGTYRMNTLLFDVETVNATTIDVGKLGIVTVRDGASLPEGAIAGENIAGHNKFQNADAFLKAGGKRGLQTEPILSGTYYINPWFAEVTQIEMTLIPIGNVGVVISYVGEEGVDTSGVDFKHGNIVSKGQKGVWAEPLQPGKYPINTSIAKIEIVPTTNLVLNWADNRSEAHKLDENLCTIKVRSKDGFTFNLDVSQIIHIPMNEAPKVIARFGNMINLVNQVLEPTIGNYFRNSAQDSDVITFLSQRQERQEAAKQTINKVLDSYNVSGVDTLIGDITPPAELMKTLTDRKIAQEQDTTYQQKIITEKTRQTLEETSAVADMQKDVVKANQGVTIAEKIADANVKKATGEKDATKSIADGNAYRIEVEGTAEGKKITSVKTAEATGIREIGKATAEAYQLQTEAIGKDNLTQMKVMEIIGANKLQLVPRVLITGGNGAEGTNGAVSGLLGMQIMKNLSDAEKQEHNQDVAAK